MKKYSFKDKVIAGHKTKTSKERSMNQIKYFGMDIHKSMAIIAVLYSKEKLIAESIIEIKAFDMPFHKTPYASIRNDVLD